MLRFFVTLSAYNEKRRNGDHLCLRSYEQNYETAVQKMLNQL